MIGRCIIVVKKKVTTSKGKSKAKNTSPMETFIFRLVSVISVALVFTAGQRIGELVYYLFS